MFVTLATFEITLRNISYKRIILPAKQAKDTKNKSETILFVVCFAGKKYFSNSFLDARTHKSGGMNLKEEKSIP